MVDTRRAPTGVQEELDVLLQSREALATVVFSLVEQQINAMECDFDPQTFEEFVERTARIRALLDEMKSANGGSPPAPLSPAPVGSHHE